MIIKKYVQLIGLTVCMLVAIVPTMAPGLEERIGFKDPRYLHSLISGLRDNPRIAQIVERTALQKAKVVAQKNQAEVDRDDAVEVAARGREMVYYLTQQNNRLKLALAVETATKAELMEAQKVVTEQLVTALRQKETTKQALKQEIQYQRQIQEGRVLTHKDKANKAKQAAQASAQESMYMRGIASQLQKYQHVFTNQMSDMINQWNRERIMLNNRLETQLQTNSDMRQIYASTSYHSKTWLDVHGYDWICWHMHGYD